MVVPLRTLTCAKSSMIIPFPEPLECKVHFESSVFDLPLQTAWNWKLLKKEHSSNFTTASSSIIAPTSAVW